MKKRILCMVTILCLLLAQFPVTAFAADFWDLYDGGSEACFIGIKYGQIYCGDTYFTTPVLDEDIDAVFWYPDGNASQQHVLTPDESGRYKLEAGLGQIEVGIRSNYAAVVLIKVTINTDHTDSNDDHVCDGCGERLTNKCTDHNRDHRCDTCKAQMSTCEDANHDHICEYCENWLGKCEDADNDHECDYGCGKTFGEHKAADGTHTCSYCGQAASECKDETPKDHKCDICGATISSHNGGTATCTDKAVCDYCENQYGDLDKMNHVGGTEIKGAKEATCTEDGYTGDTYCKGCGIKLSDGTVISATNHTFVDGKCTCGAVKYTVTFDANGGNVDTETVTTDIYGKLNSLPTPTRSGSYRFDGWFTAQNGGTEITTKTTFTENTTAYAHWTYTGSSTPTYSITAPTAENGTVTVSPKYASKGTTVTITVTPDAGYTLETLTVLDKNGNAIELTDKGNGKYSFKMPAGKVTVNATFMDDNTMLNFFTDVTADKYYYDAVLWAAKNGITGGTTATTFSPDDGCGRGQLVTFLWRVAGCPAAEYEMNFSDVGSSYYTEAVRWAASLGIVGGYGNGQFGAEDTITREQMAVILYRFAQAMGMDTTQGGMAVREYKDYETISDYAVTAIQWAVNAGVMQGYDGNLMPDQPCTRAQIVTMLYRLLGA